LQNRISEIRDLNADVVAISSKGNRKSEEKTKKTLHITFSIIPGPERKTAEAFGVWNSKWQLAIATVIVDKQGKIQFVHEGSSNTDRPEVSEIIRKLKEINQTK
jgi:peroxiredoxin